MSLALLMMEYVLMESDNKFDFDVMSDSIKAYSGLHVKNEISLACFFQRNKLLCMQYRIRPV